MDYSRLSEALEGRKGRHRADNPKNLLRDEHFRIKDLQDLIGLPNL